MDYAIGNLTDLIQVAKLRQYALLPHRVRVEYHNVIWNLMHASSGQRGQFISCEVFAFLGGIGLALINIKIELTPGPQVSKDRFEDLR